MTTEYNAFVIAIDGYSSTGKSTLAKLLAARLGYVYIDTGAMYRAVTLYALRRGRILGNDIDKDALRHDLAEISIRFKCDSQKGTNETILNGECVEKELRGMEVSEYVSAVSGIDFVREFLVTQQREMGKSGGVVMDGRDIGSVVFPDAEVKFFFTALPEIRARRRYEELIAKGEEVDYAEVEENVKKRDYLDANRAISPLRQVPDAILVDTGSMTIEEELEFMLEKIREVKDKR